MTTAIVIANGPSLTQEDVDACRGHGRVYAVKEAVYAAPWADVVYCADDDWWDLKEGLKEFTGEKWTCNEPASQRHALEHVDIDFDIIWGGKGVIASGGNSGFQTMNLAYIQGATKIILLGFDYGFTGTKKHWFDGGPHHRSSRSSNYKDYLKRINLAAGCIDIPVLNASRETAITCFPRMPLHECL
mgnify:CR=1 FL=1